MAISARTAAIAALIVANALASAAVADPRRGAALARRSCTSCHVVASGQAQANPAAPPFPTVARRPGFDREKLAFFLLEPHPKTPTMGLGRRDVTDLADYIATLAKK